MDRVSTRTYLMPDVYSLLCVGIASLRASLSFAYLYGICYELAVLRSLGGAGGGVPLFDDMSQDSRNQPPVLKHGPRSRMRLRVEELFNL